MVQIPEKSKAMVLTEYGKPLQMREYPIPELAPRGILVKVEMAGICGSDVHQWHGRLGLGAPLPTIQGHETLGRIVELGKGRTQDAAGEPVNVGDLIMWAQVDCGECFWCKVARQPNLCVKRAYYGLWGSSNADQYPHLTGGLAEYEYVTPNTDIVKIPDGLQAEEVIGVGCAFRTVIAGFEKLGGIGIQSNVVVQGAGPIGLYSILLAAEGGAGKIIVVGAPKTRLELAKKWGADTLIDIDEIKDPQKRKDEILNLTHGRGADIVVEAAGVVSAFGEGLDMIRRGGKYLVLGQTSEATISIVPGRITFKSLDIVGNMSGTIQHYYKALRFIKSKRSRYNFAEIVTHKYRLEEANDALAAMEAGKEIKPVIDNRNR
jgi:L-iditol 2-dehydrogenase